MLVASRGPDQPPVAHTLPAIHASYLLMRRLEIVEMAPDWTDTFVPRKLVAVSLRLAGPGVVDVPTLEKRIAICVPPKP